MRRKLLTLRTTAAILMLFILCSCATTKITHSKKGKYEYNSKDERDDFIDVSVSLLPLPKSPKKIKEKPKTFFDLRDSIPNTLLKVIAEKTDSAHKIIELIKEPLSIVEKEKPSSKIDTDFTSFKVRFLFSNIKKFFINDDLMHDNTRLEFLNTTLTLDDALTNVKIHTIDKLENELEKIDLGTLERTNDVTFNTKLSAQNSIKNTNGSTLNNLTEDGDSIKNNEVKKVYDEDGNLLGSIGIENLGNTKSSNTETKNNSRELSKGLSAEASYNNSENIKENVILNKNTVKTGFSFTPKKITIAQRGRPLKGILDNVILTATLKFTHANSSNVFYFSNLFDKYEPNKSDNINIEKYNIGYIQCNEVADELNFSFKVGYDGALRAAKNVVKGNNIGEFDDRVKFYRISKDAASPDEIPKISKFEYCKKVFEIGAYEGDIKPENKYTLKIDRFGIIDKIYMFQDDNPELFYGWLNRLFENPTTDKLQTKKFRLFFEKNKADSRTGVKDKIYLIKGKMTQSDIDKLKKLTLINFEEKPKKKIAPPKITPRSQTIVPKQTKSATKKKGKTKKN